MSWTQKIFLVLCYVPILLPLLWPIKGVDNAGPKPWQPKR